MKRFTAILLTGMMIFTLASCGKKAQDTSTEPAIETQAAEKVEMPTETEAVTEVVTEAAKETQQTETKQTEAQQEEQTAEQQASKPIHSSFVMCAPTESSSASDSSSSVRRSRKFSSTP